MVPALFALIGWITISVFFIIPKSLNKYENTIIFFILTIIVINIYTILTINMHFIEHSLKSEMFFSLLIHRNIILPLGLIIYVNLFLYENKVYKKIIYSVITFLLEYFIELLTLWTGVKTYTGWTHYLTIIIIAVEMLVFICIGKLLKKVN